MAIKDTSVAYMEKYLNYAVTFEKYVHLWTDAMNSANRRMQQIYAEKHRLEQLKSNAQARLTALNNTAYGRRRLKDGEAELYRRKAKTALTVALVFMSLFFLLGCGLGVAATGDSVLPPVATVLILGIAVMLIGSLFTWVVPISLGKFVANKAKAKQYAREGEEETDPSSLNRQELLLRDQERRALQGLMENRHEEAIVSMRQNEIQEALAKAIDVRNKLYAENLLDPSFRNLPAVATMYDYLASGRCDTIKGHGGIFDTYKTEKLQLEQLYEMIKINKSLEIIKQNQCFMIRQLNEVNHRLSGIQGTLHNIEKNTEEIARNTAISAEADKQTAAATSYMAWRMRH